MVQPKLVVSYQQSNQRRSFIVLPKWGKELGFTKVCQSSRSACEMLFAATRKRFFCHKWSPNTTKGLNAHSKVPSKKYIKALHGRIPGDFLKPSLVFRISPDSRTIHSTAMENTLTSM